MKAKIFIIIGVVIAIPFIAVVGLIVIMSSVIGVVSIGGGSDGSNDSGYLFRDLPFLFLKIILHVQVILEVVAIRQVRGLFIIRA